ncbi:MAG: sensor histidine kinase [Chloroflexi bacterium]|nr:sensor histidine kinase [Chloroflexota bacterium]
MSDDIREARRITDETVKGIRDFTRRLRPPILDDLGIVAAISRMLADFSERTGTKSNFNLVGEDRRLPSDIELTMFRTAQEAIRNVEQHAQATRVVITMTFSEENTVLEISDNGVGFSIPAATGDFEAGRHGHMGLISMQERAESVGGKLEVNSTPTEGTRVTVSFPASSSAAR